MKSEVNKVISEKGIDYSIIRKRRMPVQDWPCTIFRNEMHKMSAGP